MLGAGWMFLILLSLLWFPMLVLLLSILPHNSSRLACLIPLSNLVIVKRTDLDFAGDNEVVKGDPVLYGLSD